jgi:hypothetical protein
VLELARRVRVGALWALLDDLECEGDDGRGHRSGLE